MKANTPSKHVMAIATYWSLLPMVYFLPKVLHPYLPDNDLIRLMILLAIIVPFTSYIILPSVVRLIRFWGA
ncbi:hypothetical protein ABF162_26525 (plasmid) [Vibrio coralliilyticus]|uniref:hypothetical protein n=1 Tax=Vibrio coralliilyticus TaxID=190893 RepID=UPI00051296C9|nr:hypothetical protein [Vibrio coralliilyticus]AIS58246.1 hypothetical protein JV59_24695 [Vibrio coralliilyticus]